MSPRTVADRLLALADLLDLDLAHELRRLAMADSTASQLLEAQDRAKRAEDLARECQRQLHARDRQYDRLAEQHAGCEQPGSHTMQLEAGKTATVLGPAVLHILPSATRLGAGARPVEIRNAP